MRRHSSPTSVGAESRTARAASQGARHNGSLHIRSRWRSDDDAFGRERFGHAGGSFWHAHKCYILLQMLLKPAVEADYAEIIALVNLAFRGSGPSASWNLEEGIMEGQRLDESLLREDLAAKPAAFLLTHRDELNGTLLGTVWLEPRATGVWSLGLLTVRPDLQNRQLGRTLLAAAEDFAKKRGAIRIRMTVLNVRKTLIEWYERRGYSLLHETQPFPYGDERYGRPLRNDLHFVVLEKEI
jgi:GNAT superfamily N-acetyltransferase